MTGYYIHSGASQMILQPLPVLNSWSNGLLPERESLLSSLTYSPPDADHHPLRSLFHLYTIQIGFLFYIYLIIQKAFQTSPQEGRSKSPFLEGLPYSGIGPRFLGPLISRIAAHITSWKMTYFRSPFLSPATPAWAFLIIAKWAASQVISCEQPPAAFGLVGLFLCCLV